MYNGWANKDTWLAYTWLTNDENLLKRYECCTHEHDIKRLLKLYINNGTITDDIDLSKICYVELLKNSANILAGKFNTNKFNNGITSMVALWLANNDNRFKELSKKLLAECDNTNDAMKKISAEIKNTIENLVYKEIDDKEVNIVSKELAEIEYTKLAESYINRVKE